MTDFEYTEHITKEGERWDEIAYEEYGDCYKTAPLYMANPNAPIIPYLPSGIIIKVPVLKDSELQKSILPPWKESL